MSDTVALQWKTENGWELITPIHSRKVAIVGSHPKTRQNAPYDDPTWEVWLFNEAAQKPEIYRRWDALLQIHKPEIYTSLTNWVNKDHWAWLQQDHGDRRIFMQEVDPRVPNSVRYPLEGVLSLVPYRYLRSSPAMALALAIYLGYDEISLYGSELTSNTEYRYQAINLSFWIGFAHGHGVKFNLECWQDEFDQPVYGFEGSVQIDAPYFEARAKDMEVIARQNKWAFEKTQLRLVEALVEFKAEKVAELLADLEYKASMAGESAAVLSEAKRYLKRAEAGEHIDRQEFERVSAQAQEDGEKKKELMVKESGKAEYVWNVWRKSPIGEVRNQALEQLRTFTKSYLEYAGETGAKHGVMRENQQYAYQYDSLVTAAGGQRAVIAAGGNQGGAVPPPPAPPEASQVQV